MTPRNPIDDLFRQRLEQYELEPSPTLWTSIDQERNWSHRLSMRIRRNRPMVAGVLFLLAGTTGGLFFQQNSAPELGYFPVKPEHAGATVVAAIQTIAAPSLPIASTYRMRSLQKPAAKAEISPAEAAAISGARQESIAAVISLPEQVAEVTMPGSPVEQPDGSLPTISRLLRTSFPAPSRELECVRFGKARDWKFFVEANAGPAYGLRRLESLNEELSQHAGLRRNTETPQVSFSAGVRLSVHTDFGLAVRSGLQYTQLNERFDYTDNNEEKITITNIYGPSGEIIGTDTLIEKGMRRQISANRYSLIDIPFLAGYELRRKNWTLAFNGGPIINLMLQSRGNFLSPEDQRPTRFFSFTSQAGAGEAYRSSVDIGWYAGMGIYYKLDDGLQLAVEPNLRYYPQSFTRESYGVRQQYTVASLSIGLRKQI